jgi:hypothetical protein
MESKVSRQSKGKYQLKIVVNLVLDILLKMVKIVLTVNKIKCRKNTIQIIYEKDKDYTQ